MQHLEDGRLICSRMSLQRLTSAAAPISTVQSPCANDNFRSPRAIVDVINAMNLAEGRA